LNILKKLKIIEKDYLAFFIKFRSNRFTVCKISSRSLFKLIITNAAFEIGRVADEPACLSAALKLNISYSIEVGISAKEASVDFIPSYRVRYSYRIAMKKSSLRMKETLLLSV